MTEKDIKKLNRYQLSEMLILQTEHTNKLQRKVDELQAKLDSCDVQMTAIGSIAEASLLVSGVFEAAQKAADLYVSEVKERASAIEADANRRAEEIIKEANRKARLIREGEEAKRILFGGQ